MSRAYARQLSERGEPHLASLHLLALGDVHAALGVYRAAGMLREAAELGAARLLPEDPALLVRLCPAGEWRSRGSIEGQQRQGV